MKRIEFSEHGGPAVLTVVDRSEPAPGPGELTIDVHASGVNFADTLQRRGTYPMPVSLPYAPGSEAVGTVSRLGAGVTTPPIGTRVAALVTSGAYAERVVVRADRAVAVPPPVSDADALALLVQGLTAYGLAETLPDVNGRWVFVSAAVGGVGSILLQLLRERGARVIAGVSGAKKLAAATDIGAEVAVRYDEPGWVDAVQARIAPDSVSAVVDAVGGDVYRGATSLVGPFGTILVYGAASGELVGAPPDLAGRIIFANQRLVGFALPHLLEARSTFAQEAFAALFSARDRGALRLLPATTFALDDAASAHAAIESRTTVGKVILSVGGPS